MELVPHKQFGEIRLHQFLAADDIRELDNWEVMDEDWVGEAVGFTEVLRPARKPDVVRLVALDLDELTAETQCDLWSALQLPLRRGMSLVQLTAILGEPVKTFRFAGAQDRLT